MMIVANWKAYVTDLKAARALARAAERVASKDQVIVLAPSAPLVAYLRDNTHRQVTLAMQDISESAGGAATGETTAAAAKAAGAAYVILGHSERRANGEDDALIARKAQAAFAAGLTPILCVGERERDADAEYLSTVRTQIATVVESLQPDERIRIVIAYEPVWAIGKPAQDAIAPDDLVEMVRYIRKSLESFIHPGDAQNISILYGGSVEPTNIQALAHETGIQGFLVGRASTDPKTFTALARAIR